MLYSIAAIDNLGKKKKNRKHIKLICCSHNIWEDPVTWNHSHILKCFPVMHGGDLLVRRHIWSSYSITVKCRSVCLLVMDSLHSPLWLASPFSRHDWIIVLHLWVTWRSCKCRNCTSSSSDCVHTFQTPPINPTPFWNQSPASLPPSTLTLPATNLLLDGTNVWSLWAFGARHFAVQLATSSRIISVNVVITHRSPDIQEPLLLPISFLLSYLH